MGWQSVPWLVGGGAQHPPEVARLLAYAAMGGAEGVVGVDDCLVQALATPGTSIRVSTGGVVLTNRSAGGGQQSYVGRCSTEDVVAVTPTGAGSTRYDLVVVRVEDPQYPPWSAPGDPANGPYIKSFIVTNVASTTTTAAQLNLGYPAVALARLAIPPSTSTITSGMITDLRRVARPRRERILRTTALTTGQTDSIGTSATDGEAWPDASTAWTVDVPEWATRVRLVAMWNGVKVPANSNYFGAIWARIGSTSPVDTQHIAWDVPNVAANSRMTLAVADDVAVPAAMRGTTQPVNLRGKNTGGTTGFIYVDEYSSISLDVEFLEKAS